MKSEPRGTLENWRKREQILEAFERAWQSGQQPKISEYLAAAPEHDRPLLFRELMAIELEFRRKSGDTIVPAIYQQQFPEHAAVVEDLLSEAATVAPALPITGDTPVVQRDLYATRPTVSNEVPPAFEIGLRFLRPHAGCLGQLGPFLVTEKIGEGGMGWVFQAEDPVVKRRIALKVMKPELMEDGTARARFLREAQSAAAIEHDHIIPVYQVGEDNGVIFIAMPLLKGQSLENRLQDPAPMPLNLILQIARQTAVGLGAAHARGVIHRDIKPANLWLEERPDNSIRVKILDFGLARPVESEAYTQTHCAVGTPGYIAPEQLNGETCDARTDLFALGCVVYRLATRQPAFVVKSIIATLQAPPTPPAQVNPLIPPALSDLIMRMLEKNPADRPASATEVLQALERSAAETAGPGGSPTQTQSLPTHERRRRWPWIAGGAAVLLLIAGIAWRLNSSDNDPQPNPPVQPATLRAELEMYVWKKAEPTQRRNLADPKVLLLQAGDEVQIIAKANRPAYFYVVQAESSGDIAPMYPWIKYDWEHRKPEQPRDYLRIPDDPLVNAAPLTDSPTGLEAIFFFVRQTPLTAKEQADLKHRFQELPKADKQELLRGAVWLSERGAPTFSMEQDRGRLELPNDRMNRFRTLLQADLPRLFADTRVVCYSFKGAK